MMFEALARIVQPPQLRKDLALMETAAIGDAIRSAAREAAAQCGLRAVDGDDFGSASARRLHGQSRRRSKYRSSMRAPCAKLAHHGPVLTADRRTMPVLLPMAQARSESDVSFSCRSIG
jgi:hypothetical protein